MNRSLDEIAALVNGVVVGDTGVRITGLNGIREAALGDLTFLGSPRYAPFLETTGASAVLVPQDYVQAAGRPLIQVQDPYTAFALVLKELETELVRHPKGVHPTAVLGTDVELGRNVALGAHVVVADGCRIGDDVVIYAGCYIGHEVCIGENSVVYPNVTIRERVRVGARCVLHSGTVLGADGFGFVTDEQGVRRKIPQVGTVVLGDDVEIGANTAIDRATCGETFIGCGTKIDNLVQIGHNVRIGENCVVSGKTGIAGSAIIGNGVTIAAQVGIAGHLEIGDNAIIAARSGVTKSVPPGKIVSGFPATDHNAERRLQASMRHLPDLARKLRALEARLQQLEELSNGQTADDS
jgi:UDP-3-O-[3-hydroxymyristoyl] glucosamine N-acyltransferase